ATTLTCAALELPTSQPRGLSLASGPRLCENLPSGAAPPAQPPVAAPPHGQTSRPRSQGNAPMSRFPRSSLQAALAGCLAAALLPAPARPQQPAPDPVVPGASGGPYAADSGQADTRLPRIAKLIPQYLADKEWDTLAHALQALLEVPHGTLL